MTKIHGNKGKKRTDEWKKKRSEDYSGENNPFYGKKHTENSKEKLSKANKGKLLGEKNPSKRITVKKKISLAHIGKKKDYYSPSRFIKGREGMKGCEHPNWKGGITPESQLVRHSIQARLWREAVFARDNWTCQKTGIKGGNLCVHHIKNFADFPELRFAIDNGITLSKKSHDDFHKKYGWTNNTNEQMSKFINENYGD